MGLSVLAIGSDRAWRVRMQRMLSLRGELEWRGTFAADAVLDGVCSATMLWLVDGDDPMMDRACSRLRPSEPIRIHFYCHPDVVTLRRCAQVGGSGCIDKQAPLEVVLHGIREVGCGLFAVERQLLLRALGREPAGAASQQRSNTGLPATHWPHLTERQCEIVRCAAQGLSNKHIARRLGISPETVKTHMHHIFEREGISGRFALLAAHRNGSGIDQGPHWTEAISALLGQRDDRRRSIDRRGRH